MKKRRRVAILCSMGILGNALVLRGVTKYAQSRGGWEILVNPETEVMSNKSLVGWHGDGVISTVYTKADVASAKQLKIPVVNLAGRLRDPGLPRVMIDHEALGHLAAEHLLERGFQRFGFVGSQREWYAVLRQRGFVDRVARDGYRCSVIKMPLHLGLHYPWQHWLGLLDEWVKSLRPPVGIMGLHDQRASMVIDSCLRLGLRVPDDVAVIGAGNDEITCEFCRIPISSVLRNSEKVGYETAALLDRLMSGKPAPKQDILIPPEGVVSRLSTDVMAVEDPEVAAVLQYLRKHVEEIEDVAGLERVTPLARRSLERRFRQVMDRTPNEFILLARVERAKKLLVLTGPEKLQLQEIARMCGFSESRRLRLVFHRITGVTPAEYRRQRISGPSDPRL